MKRKRNFIILAVLGFITLLMLAIAWIPGAEKVVPIPVVEFARKFYALAVGALLVVVGAFLFPLSIPAAVALVVVGVAVIIVSVFINRKIND